MDKDEELNKAFKDKIQPLSIQELKERFETKKRNLLDFLKDINIYNFSNRVNRLQADVTLLKKFKKLSNPSEAIFLDLLTKFAILVQYVSELQLKLAQTNRLNNHPNKDAFEQFWDIEQPKLLKHILEISNELDSSEMSKAFDLKTAEEDISINQILGNNIDFSKILEEIQEKQKEFIEIRKNSQVDNFPASYKGLINNNANELLQAKEILNDYTKNDSLFMRYLHGHMARHHTAAVHQIVLRIGSNKSGGIHSIEGLIDALEDINLINNEGSLARRIRFIKLHCNSEEFTPEPRSVVLI